MLVIGLKGSSGTIALDGTPQLALSEDDVNTLVQPGSEARAWPIRRYACRMSAVHRFVLHRPAVLFRRRQPLRSRPRLPMQARANGATAFRASSCRAHFDNGRAKMLATAIERQSTRAPELPVTATEQRRDVDRQMRGYSRESIHPHAGYDAATEHGDERLAGGSSVTGGGVFFTSGAGTESVSTLLTNISAVGICTHRARAERHDKLAID